MMKAILPALALAVLVPAAARAGQVMNVPPFKSIEVHGGAHATLRHGEVQRVVLIKGDADIAEIRVTADGRLMLSPCKDEDTCWGHHELEVDVTTPAIAGVSVHGGGELVASGDFPVEPSLAVSVHGGGDADLRAIPAETVSASVHGGGDADLRATKMLNASVHGGGTLTYWGHPQVTASEHGGGSIESGE
jgi:Putative auto-transporter adhesin, head GIN domain